MFAVPQAREPGSWRLYTLEKKCPVHSSPGEGTKTMEIKHTGEEEPCLKIFRLSEDTWIKKMYCMYTLHYTLYSTTVRVLLARNLG